MGHQSIIYVPGYWFSILDFLHFFVGVAIELSWGDGLIRTVFKNIFYNVDPLLKVYLSVRQNQIQMRCHLTRTKWMPVDIFNFIFIEIGTDFISRTDLFKFNRLIRWVIQYEETFQLIFKCWHFFLFFLFLKSLGFERSLWG